MRRVLPFVTFLVLLFCGAWTLSRVTARPQDALNIMFSRVRNGMSLDEAVTAIWDEADSIYIEGRTVSGRSIDSLVVTRSNLPVPSEVEYGELAAEASTGGEVDVILGRGGIVAGKRFKPETTWELWLFRLHQAFGH